MWSSGWYAETFLLAEGREAEGVREHYNFVKQKEERLKEAQGFDKIALEIDIERDARDSEYGKVVAGHERRRRELMLMPTCAGVAEIEYSRLVKTDRAEIHWELCRAALAVGRFAEMAKELGIERPRRTYADSILPLVKLHAERQGHGHQLTPPGLVAGDAASSSSPPSHTTSPTAVAAASRISSPAASSYRLSSSKLYETFKSKGAETFRGFYGSSSSKAANNSFTRGSSAAAKGKKGGSILQDVDLSA